MFNQPSDPRRIEDQYFADQDRAWRQRLRAQVQQRAAAEADRCAIAEALRSTDSLAERVRSLGFDARTAPAFCLMPLVEVAWADHEVTPPERNAIMAVAAAHGVEPHSEAGQFIAAMLEQRPDQKVLDGIRDLLRDVLRAQNMHPHNLLEACIAVAAASGGLFGLGYRVNAEERRLIEQLNQVLRTDTDGWVNANLA